MVGAMALAIYLLIIGVNVCELATISRRRPGLATAMGASRCRRQPALARFDHPRRPGEVGRATSAGQAEFKTPPGSATLAPKKACWQSLAALGQVLPPSCAFADGFQQKRVFEARRYRDFPAPSLASASLGR
jgi:hypothetical protein